MLPNILYQDEDLLLMEKPTGYFAHPTKLDKTAPDCQSWLKNEHHLKAQPAHRLDRATSGLLLFGLHSEASRNLMLQFQSGSVHKEYQALLRGWLKEGEELDYAIQTDRGLQEAKTSYQPLTHYEMPWGLTHKTSRYTWVQLHPHSGRQHQLRKHMAHLRHPIIGDSSHGDNKQNRLLEENLGITRMWLFATRMEILHPRTGERLRFESSEAADFTAKISPYSLVINATDSP